jgi:hypothetical protein
MLHLLQQIHRPGTKWERPNNWGSANHRIFQLRRTFSDSGNWTWFATFKLFCSVSASDFLTSKQKTKQNNPPVRVYLLWMSSLFKVNNIARWITLTLRKIIALAILMRSLKNTTSEHNRSSSLYVTHLGRTAECVHNRKSKLSFSFILSSSFSL